MKYMDFNLNQAFKIEFIGKEHLIPPRAHITRKTSTAILYFILKGKLELEVNGHYVCLEPGDVYIFCNGDHQKPVNVSDVEYYWIHFLWDGNTLEISDTKYNHKVIQKNIDFLKMQNHDMRRYEHWQITVKQKTHINNPKTRDWLVREFEQCINHYWHNSVESHYWMSAMFSRILCRLEDIGLASEDVAHPAEKNVFNTVIAISSYINEHLDEDIGKQVMEEHFRLNYDYMNRIFNRIIGDSIVHYRNMQRIERAKRFLLTTDMDAEQIAAQLGFSNKYYFIRYFKRITGISPMAYKMGGNENAL